MLIFVLEQYTCTCMHIVISKSTIRTYCSLQLSCLYPTSITKLWPPDNVHFTNRYVTLLSSRKHLYTVNIDKTAHCSRCTDIIVYDLATYLRDIPFQFNQGKKVTLSEFDETWYISSICETIDPWELLSIFIVWLLN